MAASYIERPPAGDYARGQVSGQIGIPASRLVALEVA
jgi:hypothetical protein